MLFFNRSFEKPDRLAVTAAMKPLGVEHLASPDEVHGSIGVNIYSLFDVATVNRYPRSRAARSDFISREYPGGATNCRGVRQ
ncbi:hypothetical protein [Bradyrhizobium sp. HKCCYLRH1065]|uniref:hypothetical protein n=1 Tax=Bradyrhizobium sp. HKCCYLRH1065 TaxID=3420753 RepID=UPI003EBC9683